MRKHLGLEKYFFFNLPLSRGIYLAINNLINQLINLTSKEANDCYLELVSNHFILLNIFSKAASRPSKTSAIDRKELPGGGSKAQWETIVGIEPGLWGELTTIGFQ